MINKNLLLLGGVAVVALGLLYFGGYLDDAQTMIGLSDVPTPADSTRLSFDKNDIHSLLVVATGKPLNRETTYRYIDSLNMKLYGSDSHYNVIETQYRTHFSSWALIYDVPMSSGRLLMWQNNGNAASVITQTSSNWQSMYGYQTLTLTAEGSVVDYTSFYSSVMTS